MRLHDPKAPLKSLSVRTLKLGYYASKTSIQFSTCNTPPHHVLCLLTWCHGYSGKTSKPMKYCKRNVPTFSEPMYYYSNVSFQPGRHDPIASNGNPYYMRYCNSFYHACNICRFGVYILVSYIVPTIAEIECRERRSKMTIRGSSPHDWESALPVCCR